MGNTLPKPITTKKTETGGCCDRKKNDKDGGGGDDSGGDVRWGVSSMQGWRVSMEDAHIAEEIRHIQDPASGELLELDTPHYLFCVLDGHGGSTAAEYSRDHLSSILYEQPEFVQYCRIVGQVKPAPAQEGHPSHLRGNKNHNKKETKNKKNNQSASSQNDIGLQSELLQRALENAFVELDFRLLQEMVQQKSYILPPDPQNRGGNNNDEGAEDEWGVELLDPELEVLPRPPDKPNSVSGTTATAALVTPDMIICANVGDSRTIIDAYPLSTDHKPHLPEERQRILDANGVINFGRVDGELAVSRAIGDYEFKAYHPSHLIEGLLEDIDLKRTLAQTLKVSPFPEITCHYRSDTDQALILACDGIWDVLSNIHCHELVQRLCEEGESNVGLIAEEILDVCLKRGSRDNMTVLVALLPAQVIGTGGGVLKRRKQGRRTYH